MPAYHYAIYRFLPDPARGEILNLGVVVVDDERRDGRCRLLPNWRQRLRMRAPADRLDHLLRAVEAFQRQVGAVGQASFFDSDASRIVSAAQLKTLAAHLNGHLRLSPPREHTADSLEAATDQLYHLYVAPMPAQGRSAPSGSSRPSIEEIRRSIRALIRTWRAPGLRLLDGHLQASALSRHYADFWLAQETPIAALVALRDEPDERDDTWLRRDCLPSLAQAFRALNPRFTAVGVFPDGPATPFVEETRAYLANRPGLAVRTIAELADPRDWLLTGMM
jgi:hypothetical protein